MSTLTKKRAWAVCTTVLLAAGLVVTGATAASATTTPPATKVVTWHYNNPKERWESPGQTLVANGDTSTCGTGAFQVDTYKYQTPAQKAKVDALIAGGRLTSSGTGPLGDGDVYISNIPDIVQTPCTPPVILKDATADVTITTAATCTAPGVATLTQASAVLSVALDETVGTHTATFTAAAGHAFADGAPTLTKTYTIPAANTALCPIKVTIPEPKVIATCQDGYLYNTVIPADVPHTTFVKGGGMNHIGVVYTADAGYVIEGKSTFDVVHFSGEKCPVVVTPPVQHPGPPAHTIVQPGPTVTTLGLKAHENVAPAVVAAPKPQASGQLAYTGSEGTTRGLVIGGLLLALGAGLLIFRRRQA